MNYKTVIFLGKEYSIPADVFTYIDLLDFTDNIQKQLTSTFVHKLKNEIANDNIGLLGDEDLATEIEQQVGRYIAKLCDNGIFTRTINDYLKSNKGYQLYSDVNKAALEKMKSILIQETDAWLAGYEDALNRAESHVTGMGFSILSGSFVNHAIYAAMQASTINKQSKEAESQYQKDMNDLSSRLESKYGREKSDYIHNTYIPNMEAALTVFVYELLDKYVADLITNGKFDSKTLDYVDIGRSNDLLKNLTLSNNRQAILENAFTACPYNIAVYMEAMKYDLLDYDSFQTAKVFKQDHHVVSFFRGNWGEVSFPTKFNIDYHCINKWASLTGKTTADLLRGLTEQYATGVVRAYSRVADMIANKSTCRKVIGELREDVILSGFSICVGKAREYVEPIVHPVIWEQLTERCGHTDLLSRIKKPFLATEEDQSKKDFDKSVTEQLAARFEEVRKELAEQIEARRAEEERQRIEREKQQAEQARIQAEMTVKRNAAIKKGVKRTLIVIGTIVAICIALIIAGIIFLEVTNKPIDDDFSQSYTDRIHNLTYNVPENWEYDSDASNDESKYYVRYDNWDDVLAIMCVNYIGEVEIITVDDAVSDYTAEYEGASVINRKVGTQNFSIVSYVRESDNYGCYVYITEKNSSVFQIYFRFTTEDSGKAIFEEIVEAFAFDTYVNPKEDTYNEAIGLMSAGIYNEAISIFTELGGYKDSAEKIKECENAIIESNYSEASRLLQVGDYASAYDILIKLNNYPDAVSMLKNFKWMPTESTYISVKSSESNSYHTYTYDDNGILIKEVINDSTVVTYSYDSHGNMIMKKYTYSDGDTSRYEYKYNASNQLMQERYTYPDGSVDVINYTYDSNGRISEAEDIHWGSFNERLTYSYDSAGKLIKKDTIDHFDSLGCYEYQYDEHGRLIKEIHTTDIGESYSVVYTKEYFYSTDGYLIAVYDYKGGRKTGYEAFDEYIVFYSPEGFSG